LILMGSRFYDPALARWIQPDTIVPEPGNPQTLNRYGYVNNNPLRYTDPTGHCPFCITGGIGFVVGAVVGGGMYIAYNHDSLDRTNLGVAMLAGSIAGGLIGSGIGLADPALGGAALTVAASSVTIGAGAGAAGAGTGYIATHANTFDRREFETTTTIGGVAGGISGAIPAQGVGLLAKGLVNQAAAVAQYKAASDRRGQPMTAEGVSISLATGTAAGIIDMGVSSMAYGAGAGASTFHPEGWVNSGNASLMSVAANRATGEAYVGAGVFSGSGFSSAIVTSEISRIIEKWLVAK
jgi:hypothetical protein